MSQALIKKTIIFLKKSLMLGVVVICALFTLQVQAELPVAEQLKALRQQSTDWMYGYSPTQPILLGGLNDKSGTMPERMREYFAWLSSPKEISISAKDPGLRWRRVGACCSFKTPNGPIEETGLLDIYEVTVPGERPVRLFVNHYDEGMIMAPSGLYLHLSNNWQKEWAPALAAYRKGAWQQAVDELKKLVAVQQGKGGGLAEYLLQISWYNLKDEKQSNDWRDKATELGQAEALADAGVTFVKYFPATAEEMWTSAILKGSSFAAWNMGTYLSEKDDPEKKLSGLLYLYMAAEQGEVGAQIELAQFLHAEKLKSVASRTLKLLDTAEIMMWLQIAKLSQTEQSRTPGLNVLIQVYAKDFAITDLKPSESAAKAWLASFRRPDFAMDKYVEALSGNPQSQLDYALLLSQGYVVPQDNNRATALLILACQAKDERAEKIFQLYAGFSCQDLNAANVSKIVEASKKVDIENALQILQVWIK